MSKPIHRKDTPGGTRYRVWSTVVDAYITPQLDRAGLIAWIRRDHERTVERDIAETLAALDERATTSRMRPREPSDPWCGE